MSNDPTPKPDGQSNHEIVEDSPTRQKVFNDAHVAITVVGNWVGNSPGKKLVQYWWNVTPDHSFVGTGAFKVTWHFNAIGVNVGDPWAGVNARLESVATDSETAPSSDGMTATMTFDTPPGGGKIKYSVTFSANGEEHTFDPELELGADQD